MELIEETLVKNKIIQVKPEFGKKTLTIYFPGLTELSPCADIITVSVKEHMFYTELIRAIPN